MVDLKWDYVAENESAWSGGVPEYRLELPNGILMRIECRKGEEGTPIFHYYSGSKYAGFSSSLSLARLVLETEAMMFLEKSS